MYKYEIYEYQEQKGSWTITDSAELELTNLDEAKREVEHCLPPYIYTRDWTTGECDSHWLIQDGYMVCLDTHRKLSNVFDADLLRTVVSRGGTQDEIGEKLNVSQQQISRWIKLGDKIKTEHLIAICNAIEIDIRTLFTRKELPEPIYPTNNDTPTFIK